MPYRTFIVHDSAEKLHGKKNHMHAVPPIIMPHQNKSEKGFPKMSKDRVNYFKVAKIKVILPSKIMQLPVNNPLITSFILSEKFGNNCVILYIR